MEKKAAASERSFLLELRIPYRYLSLALIKVVAPPSHHAMGCALLFRWRSETFLGAWGFLFLLAAEDSGRSPRVGTLGPWD